LSNRNDDPIRCRICLKRKNHTELSEEMEDSISPVLEKIKSNTPQPDYFEICNGQTDLETLTENEIWDVLMICVKECEEDVIDKFLEVNLLNKCINRQDKNGECAMIVICKMGWVSLLEKMHSIETIDINMTDKEGNTPLIHAAQAGHIDIVEFILANYKGLQIDHRNKSGFSALMKAAIQGQIDCVRTLILHGADHSLCDPARGMCSQGWAQYCNRHDTAEEVASFNRMKQSVEKTHTGVVDKTLAEPQPLPCQGLRPTKMIRIVRRSLSSVICGCKRTDANQDSEPLPGRKLPISNDQHLYIKNVVHRIHHNCHFEKGMAHPECLNKSARRNGSMIRPFNYSSPRRNSKFVVPRVEITKSNSSNNYDSFD